MNLSGVEWSDVTRARVQIGFPEKKLTNYLAHIFKQREREKMGEPPQLQHFTLLSQIISEREDRLALA